MSNFSSCKKDKILKDSSAKLEFSQDSVLFDTVFTAIGSATQNVRIRNTYSKKLKITSIQLEGGSGSQFIINVDGAKGTTFTDLEIAPHDSMYIFIQVNVNPTNINSPLIISDAIKFVVNGNEQRMILEAWGQDAYYHRSTNVITNSDGSLFPYCLANDNPNSFNLVGSEIVWKNDKPHVIYGYVVVDGPDSASNTPGQQLKIQAGTQVFLNYKAGIWVYPGGQIQVLGDKGKEVTFQGARREKDFADDPGQWDRIWISEGSDDNIINYAIIKNAFIGIQAQYTGLDASVVKTKKGQLTLTNTKIQNMSYWGLYCSYYKVFGFNNVVSNCQEYSLNLQLGGAYIFSQCTFANFWSKDKVRDKPTMNINNWSDTDQGTQILPFSLNFANCIVDGKLENELNIDIKNTTAFPASAISYTLSNNWIKTNTALTNTLVFIDNRKGGKNDVLGYKDIPTYNFEPAKTATAITNFTSSLAGQNANLISPPLDLNGKPRNTTNVTAGAYEFLP